MTVEFMEGTEEWMMFQDYYKICQEYWEPEKTDEYWDGARDAVKGFYHKYNTSMAKQLGLALMTDLATRSISVPNEVR